MRQPANRRRSSMRRTARRRTTTVLVLLALFLVGGLCGAYLGIQDFRERYRIETVTYHPAPIGDVLDNPFIGWAPSAVNGPYTYPHRLAYKNITWRDLEPEKGRFVFDELERKYGLRQWQAQGVSVILRFLMDYPEGGKHLDIPDWLYEEIDGDGIWYDDDIGQGFSPNYDNPTLIDYHRKAIAALGERYDADPLVAFVALGSLGHWGEWHTVTNERIDIPFPAMAVSDQYVSHYVSAFPHKKLLMRRPYPIAAANGIGLYNDVFGFPESTGYYEEWFRDGYYSIAAGEVDIPAMPDFWKRGPSGGEFGSTDDVRDFFKDDRIGEVLGMVERSHVSWLGLTISGDRELSGEVRRNMDRMLNRMGYRFRIGEAMLPDTGVIGRNAAIRLTVNNDGVAPFYYDWPLEIRLENEAGQAILTLTDSEEIRRWMPGANEAAFTVALPEDLLPGAYRWTIAILDPSNGRPGVAFATEGRRPDGRIVLGNMMVREPTWIERWWE